MPQFGALRNSSMTLEITLEANPGSGQPIRFAASGSRR